VNNGEITIPDTLERAPRGWTAHVVAIVAILACAAIVHGSRFVRHIDSVHPETTAFVLYNSENIHSLKDCFTKGPMYAGLYRPLSTACYYYIGRTLFGGRIALCKIVSLVVFLANAYLLYLICRLWLPYSWSLLVALLFTTRAVHTYLLIFTPEFQTLLSTFFSLLMLYFFARCRREKRALFEGLSYACFVLALLSKESSVMMAAALVVYGWLFDEKWVWRPYLVTVALAVSWARWYFFQFRGAEDYRIVEFTYSYSPTDVMGNYISHALDFFSFLTVQTGSLHFPMGNAIEVIAGSVIGQIVFGASAVACLALIALRRRRVAGSDFRTAFIAFGGAFFLLSMLPYVIVEDRLFTRYSYIGHVGIAIMIGTAVSLVDRTNWFTRLQRRKVRGS
jgi:drug/metabolite transporter superfamily protein YnfA